MLPVGTQGYLDYVGTQEILGNHDLKYGLEKYFGRLVRLALGTVGRCFLASCSFLLCCMTPGTELSWYYYKYSSGNSAERTQEFQIEGGQQTPGQEKGGKPRQRKKKDK